MKRCFISMSIGLALLVPGVVYGEPEPTLVLNGQTIGLTTPLQTPALLDVLSAYGVDVDRPETLSAFLLAALPDSVIGTDDVEAWLGRSETLDEGDGKGETFVEVDAAIDADYALITLYVADGSFHMDVTRYGEDGEPPTSMKLEYEILEAIADVETAGDVQRDTVQTCFLLQSCYSECTCDDGKGVKGCTKDDCYSANTCPDGPNGVACGWIVTLLVPQPIVMEP
ncbi:MAG: hypothetical protein JXQ75_13305 [Phycisphaerae bacterium]|nr:hypothetical protein [Phycisphaerae bacterium]